MFHLGHENNIPTYFSAIQLLMVSSLCMLIALSKSTRGQYRRHWFGLSAIFILLSFDEATMLHENLYGVGKLMVEPHGFFTYAWIVPAAICVVVFVCSYFTFLLSLPRRHAWLFCLSGAIYVGGAIGFEALSAFVVDSGMSSLVHCAVQTIEETMEMAGIAVFIFSLADYLSQFCPTITIFIASESPLR